jgi:protein-tyrosine phosphatase
VGGLTKSGMVVRSDNVSNLNQAGVQAMWDYGITTVVDLRSDGEIAKYPSPFAAPDYGPEYVHVPLLDDAFMKHIATAPSMGDKYRLMVDGRHEAFGRVVSAIARVDGPVVFHCYAGKDRTGLVAAMILALTGVSLDAIGADYAETDVHLAERYRQWLAAAPAAQVESMRDELRCPPEWMLGALDHIDARWGGMESYLGAAGVGPGDISRLQEKLAG